MFQNTEIPSYVFNGSPSVVTYRGVQHYFHSELQEALGDPLEDDRAEELVEGEHWCRSPWGVLWTTDGLWSALLLAETPLGVRVRRWLADEVLPAIRRGEFVRQVPEFKLDKDLEQQLAELALQVQEMRQQPKEPKPAPKWDGTVRTMLL